MEDAFDAGKRNFTKRKKEQWDEEDRLRNEAENVAKDVIARCKDRMQDEGYILKFDVSKILIFYQNDYAAQTYIPGDMDDDRQPFYDKELRRLYLFRLYVQHRYRNGWKLVDRSGFAISKYGGGDINTIINTAKPWADELLRVIGEFCEFNRRSAEANEEQFAKHKDSVKRKKLAAEKRNEENARAAKAAAKARENMEHQKQTKRILIIGVILVFIVAAALS